MKITSTLLFALGVIVSTASAAPETFDFKDAKDRNTVMFKLVAPKETIEGSANGISGTVTFDPANPGATKGKIVVDTKSLTVPNRMMNQHMHGAQWLDAPANPQITFEIKELKNAKTEGDKTTADAVGTFTLKGVAKDVTAPVTLTYMKDKLAERVPGQKGDLLVVKGTFSIQRNDFNVNAHKNEDKVSDKIDLTLGLAGTSAK